MRENGGIPIITPKLLNRTYWEREREIDEVIGLGSIAPTAD